MTNEQINTAIAEARGWTDISDKIPSPGECGGWAYGRMRGVNPEGYRVNVPDYCNDLNAMHEVESTLDVILGRLKFPEILAQVASRHEGFRSNGLPLPEWHRTHASARQRAEAFLRTIGKWEE